jgi:FRG domain-containing protein
MAELVREICVRSFAQFHEALSFCRRDGRWLFRGQSDLKWNLVPKLGRKPFDCRDERDMFRAWKRDSFEISPVKPEDDLEWLAIAQHHGLATRLLDWTFNPLAAAFFATAEPGTGDAAIYAWCHDEFTPQLDDPLGFEGIIVFQPRSVAQRISRQLAAFTLHGPPTLSMEAWFQERHQPLRIIIDSDYRQEMVFELSHYGVNRRNLFPDLDGLAWHLNWLNQRRAYWEGEEVPESV